MQAGLYVVATPIGNLADITLRALETLRQSGLIVAEDTRWSRKLLDHHGIHSPLISCHKFNEAARVDFILGKIHEGTAVSLITDAGTPSISDPGARLVAAARADGAYVTALPGASAVTMAISLCGFGGNGFVFDGFLTRGSNARKRRLSEIAVSDRPVVIYESPYRLIKLLGEMEDSLGDRTIYIGRELTKQFEENLVGTPSELIKKFSGRNVKGEIVIVVPAPTRAELREMEDDDDETVSVGASDGSDGGGESGGSDGV